MATSGNSQAPAGATDAVLKASAPVEGASEVRGIDFNRYENKGVTVQELVDEMTNMGFQATSIGEAVRIINDMVRIYRMRTQVTPF